MPPRTARATFPVKLPLRELTELHILRQTSLSGALVNGQGDLLYLHGRTGQYLEPAPGETGIANILAMAREGLRHPLDQALRQAAAAQEPVRCPGLRVRTNGHFTLVNLSVSPVTAGPANFLAVPLYLVLLEAAPALEAADREPSAAAGGPAPDTDQRIQDLERKLQAQGQSLQTANEERETANEELKSTNEEMQSVNEELQSTNEELETSKEELQSVNEELATVNSELQIRVADLTRSNNDLNNLLAGTGIGTIFVDHHLRIMRFSPAVKGIINLLPTDAGRPLGHFASSLAGYDRLTEDLQSVLDTLIVSEREVQTRAGQWYTMRIQPYRTLDNVIEGAVITFVDISETQKAREALRKANDLLRLAVVVRDARDAITVQDLEGRTLAWNPGAVRMYGWCEAEALTLNVLDRIPAEQREDALFKVHQLSRAEVLEPYLTQRLTRDGRVLEVSLVSTALVDETGRLYAIATTERPKELTRV